MVLEQITGQTRISVCVWVILLLGCAHTGHESHVKLFNLLNTPSQTHYQKCIS